MSENLLTYNLWEIFDGKWDRYPNEHDLIDKITCQESDVPPTSLLRPGLLTKSNLFRRVDLEGACYVISSPLELKMMDGIIISNGCIVAGPNFPKADYLMKIEGANTIKLENLLLECSKIANGIFLNKFIRVRIEDCTIMHQLHYGVYGNEYGNNHELEVVKCNIMEYVFGDGGEKSHNKEIIPYFREAHNRTSTGIFLGQADNVVADCNINLCKVGIKVGMRANRIQGNHITAGATDGNHLFNCIEINKANRSACLLVNNYFDNGRIWIETSAKKIADRNYITLTDNLFYRGFNHPNGEEFNYVVIKPRDKHSSFSNVILTNNQFYTQDADLEGQDRRVIVPIRIIKEQGSISPERTAGSFMKGNSFTHSDSFFITPQGTEVTKIVKFKEGEVSKVVNFSRVLPWGRISEIQCSDLDIKIEVKSDFKLMLKNFSGTKRDVRIKVNNEVKYSGLDYIIH